MIEKNNLKQTLDRWLAFVERRLDPGILANVAISTPPTGNVTPQAEDGAEVKECLALADLDAVIAQTASGAKSYRDVLADIYPWAYPTLNFGESVWSGFFGAPITFSGTRTHTWSYCPEPPIKDLARFPFPPLDTTNHWYRQMLEVTADFVRRLPPVCDMTPFIFMDCLNLLVELRGATAAYTELYDYPEQMGTFMDWSVDVNCAFYDAQAELMRDFTAQAFGGHPFVRYSCARIPNLSIDAYGMCAPEIYRKWGLEQHKRIVTHYGGGRLHIHGNGRHLCEGVSEIANLTLCDMGDDVGYPPAWTIVKELKERLAPVPISVGMPLDEFRQGLRRRDLPAGVLYRVTADSLADANRIIEEVFAYRAKTMV